MTRQVLYILFVCAIVSFTLVSSAVPVAAQAAPADCPLPTVIYWSPGAGSNSNNGQTPETAVQTDTRAKELAAVGGGCVYIVIGASIADTGWRIQAQVAASGHPLAKPIAYGLLLLLAVSLIVGGAWTRRHASQLQASATM